MTRSQVMKPQMDSRIDLVLPVPTHDAIRRLAVANDRSVSAEVRRAIEAHLVRGAEHVGGSRGPSE